jgi:HTH-type transcriptional regulator/antitoxin HigA
VLLVEAYERKHFPIEPPHPIDFLLHVMEARGLTRKDLEPYIGSRARVAEVLNRVRPLTLEMIRRLAAGLKLPADVLIRDYGVKKAA